MNTDLIKRKKKALTEEFESVKKEAVAHDQAIATHTEGLQKCKDRMVALQGAHRALTELEKEARGEKLPAKSPAEKPAKS